MFITSLVILAAIGSLFLALALLTQVTAQMRSFNGFEGMHLEE